MSNRLCVSGLLALIAGAVVLTVSLRSADAQLGSGSVGPGGQAVLQPVEGPNATSSLKLIVAVARERNLLLGYSSKTGEWKEQSIRGDARQVPAPVVGYELAFVRIGNRVHAFSNRTGEWDTLELKEEPRSEPSMGFEMIELHTPGAIHAFSADKGKWASVELKAD